MSAEVGSFLHVSGIIGDDLSAAASTFNPVEKRRRALSRRLLVSPQLSSSPPAHNGSVVAAPPPPLMPPECPQWQRRLKSGELKGLADQRSVSSASPAAAAAANARAAL